MATRRNSMSGGPKVPLIEKVKRTSIGKNTVSFSNDDVSIAMAASPEDINYFKDFDTYIVTFQPVAPDDDTK
jgi:hypothetical protein